MTSDLLSGVISAAPLQIKRIVTTAHQDMEVLVAVKFSLRKWLKSICRNGFGKLGRDPDTDSFNFSFSLGFYEIYEPKFIPCGSTFYMLETAILTTTKYSIISANSFHSYMKIRERLGETAFLYKEIQNDRRV